MVAAELPDGAGESGQVTDELAPALKLNHPRFSRGRSYWRTQMRPSLPTTTLEIAGKSSATGRLVLTRARRTGSRPRTRVGCGSRCSPRATPAHPRR